MAQKCFLSVNMPSLVPLAIFFHLKGLPSPPNLETLTKCLQCRLRLVHSPHPPPSGSSSQEGRWGEGDHRTSLVSTSLLVSSRLLQGWIAAVPKPVSFLQPRTKEAPGKCELMKKRGTNTARCGRKQPRSHTWPRPPAAQVSLGGSGTRSWGISCLMSWSHKNVVLSFSPGTACSLRGHRLRLASRPLRDLRTSELGFINRGRGGGAQPNLRLVTHRN